MIAQLRGELCYRSTDEVVIDAAGVGYQVYVTARGLDSLGSLGDQVRLLIYTDVRETAITLFGFATQLEREVFLLLKKVKGVGSRLALTVLSALSPEELLSCIGQSDVGALTKVPGVGKKTAERLVVELREQVGNLAIDAGVTLSGKIEMSSTSKSSGSSLQGAAHDAVLALERLGFTSDRAENAVSATMQDNPTQQDAGELVKLALSHL